MATYEQIANLWAEQVPKGPKKAGNFWRDGVKAGHWGSCVAQLIPGADGKPVALVWDSHWGNGTAAFLNSLQGAAKRAGLRVFRVPAITDKDHVKNLEFFEAQAKECEAKIARARSVDWQAKADWFRQESAAYAAAFGIGAVQSAA